MASSDDGAMSTAEIELELDSANPKQLEVVRWRLQCLRRAGFVEDQARSLAIRYDVDLHRATDLVRRGCLPELAFRILA